MLTLLITRHSREGGNPEQPLYSYDVSYGNIASVLFWKHIVAFNAVLDSRLRVHFECVTVCAKE